MPCDQIPTICSIKEDETVQVSLQSASTIARSPIFIRCFAQRAQRRIARPVPPNLADLIAKATAISEHESLMGSALMETRLLRQAEDFNIS
jgi:hypothetical protein